MSSRFGASALHQRDSRSMLFGDYSGPGGEGGRRPVSASPNRPASGLGGYGYGYTGAPGAPTPPLGAAGPGFRPATPNRRGQYSDAVLNELESQSDSQVEGIMGKVRVLKDMTMAIGEEIRESSALAEKMNTSFDQARTRLRGTMNRMLLMAERTGVGWRVWLGFFAFLIFIFMYVWLF